MKNERAKQRKFLFGTALAIVLFFYGWVSFAVAGEFPTVVKTKHGKVEGQVSADAATVSWKGIPFAKPPVGDLRWKRPMKPDKWDGIKEAADFCEICVQYVKDTTSPDNYIPYGTEDCLYLNVWRPDTKEKNLPVYFWIHGGGNSTGATSGPMYDGANIAVNSNLIVVSPNYRLGPLGWFTHPALRKGGGSDARSKSGNYGTLDIIMALKWVKKNIAAFGGDPNNVTIAGESAGGINVYSLLISPLAKGLFHKAISQSGFPWTDTVADGDASADRVINELMAIDGMTRDGMKDKQIADYLRSKTAEEILSVYTPAWGTAQLSAYEGYFSTSAEFRQVFKDGKVIPSEGFDVLGSGQYNKVPIILGINAEEEKLYLWSSASDLTPCEYQARVDATTDNIWNTFVDNVAPVLSLHQPGDVYAYRFLYGTYRHAGQDCLPDPEAFNAWTWPYSLVFGACHTLDIPFFFGNFTFYGLEPYIFNGSNSPGYENLSDTMMDYIANFAYTEEPGEVNGVVWTPWVNTITGPRIQFDANATTNLTTMSTP